MVTDRFFFLAREISKKPLGVFFRHIPYVRNVLRKSLTVFMFHDVTNHPSEFVEEYGLGVSTEEFRKQVEFIQSNFNVIRSSDLLKNDIKMSDKAAIISFDDGFLGSFENGASILKEYNMPAIFFLNMRAILEEKPILSAIACFLQGHIPEFERFAQIVKLQKPYHLSLTPFILEEFEKHYGPIDQDVIAKYQGNVANLDVVKKWDNQELVAFGNHLFDHWNSPALSAPELEDQYRNNEAALSQLNNSVNLFAFTNGQPETCFSQRDIDLLHKFGAGRVFSASGGVNRSSSSYLLDRLGVGHREADPDLFWFRLGRAVFLR